jgi:hypothetical protein
LDKDGAGGGDAGWESEDVMKRAIWMLATLVIVVVLMAALGILGINHQGPTVSEVIPSERPKAATAAVIAPGIPKERLYKVEAISFRAVDESGPDWWGSDDIYANWKDPKSGYVSLTRTYRGVNTGDTRKFAPPDKQCILPVNLPPPTFVSEGTKACSGGVPGPFDFEVALFEEDSRPIPLPLPIFCPEHRGIGISCDGDDLIDQKTVSFTTAELEAAMPDVGDTFTETIAIRTFCGVPESEADGTYGCAATGPDYRFTYKITRLPDNDLPVHP